MKKARAETRLSDAVCCALLLFQILQDGPFSVLGNDGSELGQYGYCTWASRHTQKGGSAGTGKGATRHDMAWEFGRRAARLVVYSIPGLFDAFVTGIRSRKGAKRRRGRRDTNSRVTDMIRTDGST